MSQKTLDLETPFTLTRSPAPPKTRPKKRKKAVWLDKPIKAPTQGAQRPLFKVRGQQMTLEDEL